MKGVYHQNKVKGFYYDHQIYNPLYTITLHPNTRPFPGPRWEECPSRINTSEDLIMVSFTGKDHPDRHYDKEWDAFFTNGYSEDAKGTPSDGKLPALTNGDHADYFAEPICSSIFTEDFNFAIANEWASHDGGNFLESAFKNLKPYAPFLGTLAKGIKNTDLEGVDGLGSSAASWLSSILGKAGNMAEGLEPVLNKALYIQGTRYSMYNGSATNFGNMTMKFTLLSDWKQWYPGAPDYHFMTVYDQLMYIYPYCIGFYESGLGGLDSYIQKAIKDGKVKKTVSNFANAFVGWQSPPGGFESINRNIDVQQKGTLRLILGGFYTIDNLVIKDINVNVSRQLCKNPSDGNNMVPLYADVQISLQPASVYTDLSLGRFLNSAGMMSIIKACSKINKEETNRKRQELQTEGAKKT
jgi:hypothetical protein